MNKTYTKICILIWGRIHESILWSRWAFLLRFDRILLILLMEKSKFLCNLQWAIQFNWMKWKGDKGTKQNIFRHSKIIQYLYSKTTTIAIAIIKKIYSIFLCWMKNIRQKQWQSLVKVLNAFNFVGFQAAVFHIPEPVDSNWSIVMKVLIQFDLYLI